MKNGQQAETDVSKRVKKDIKITQLDRDLFLNREQAWSSFYLSHKNLSNYTILINLPKWPNS